MSRNSSLVFVTVAFCSPLTDTLCDGLAWPHHKLSTLPSSGNHFPHFVLFLWLGVLFPDFKFLPTCNHRCQLQNVILALGVHAVWQTAGITLITQLTQTILALSANSSSCCSFATIFSREEKWTCGSSSVTTERENWQISVLSLTLVNRLTVMTVECRSVTLVSSAKSWLWDTTVG